MHPARTSRPAALLTSGHFSESRNGIFPCRVSSNMAREKAVLSDLLTGRLVPFRLPTKVTFQASGTAAISTTKRGLRRIRLSAAGKGSLTDAKRLQSGKLNEAEAIDR